MTSYLEKIIALEISHRVGAEAGDVVYQASLGSLLYTKACETLDMATLKEAEFWLIKAAEAGDKDTEEFLKTIWPKAKGDVVDRIKNKG